MDTPQIEVPELAKEVGVPRLFLKREDLHQYGSHKGRSIPHMIDVYTAQGNRDFVISSSGNAALAALRHIQKRNDALIDPKNLEKDRVTLEIILGERVSSEKRARIEREIRAGDPITVVEHPRPLQALFAAVKGRRKTSLRQSTDDLALEGYESLAEELSHTPDLSAVFIPASSGTAAQAVARNFGERAQVHFVQTGQRHPLSETWDAVLEGGISLADAIVDVVAHRKAALEAEIRKTGGRGWTVTNEEISRAQALLRDKANVEVTGNGALALAGLLRALSQGAKFSGAVVCVITGR
ncbi:MAG TPA: PLP-dependent lyase/thiolase [Candidatus Paceibacterota bacterium]|jgi:Threonine synthase